MPPVDVVAGRAMRSSYFEWSLTAGGFGLFGTPVAVFVLNLYAAVLFIALVFCAWLTVLFWGWRCDGPKALLLSLPALLLICIWPTAYAALAITCTYYYPCS
jgi:hypothetical protein